MNRRLSTGSLLVKANLNRNSSAVGLVSRHPAETELTPDWSLNSFKMGVYEKKKHFFGQKILAELKSISIDTPVRSEYSSSKIQDVVSMFSFPQ